MLVSAAIQVTCERSEQCGLAAACREGHCGPCRADADCAAGESCALDYCVKRESMSCRSRRDCPADELCILSGISPDARGNAEMRSYCAGSSGSAGPPLERLVEPGPPRPPIKPPVDPQDLLDSLAVELPHPGRAPPAG